MFDRDSLTAATTSPRHKPSIRYQHIIFLCYAKHRINTRSFSPLSRSLALSLALSRSLSSSLPLPTLLHSFAYTGWGGEGAGGGEVFTLARGREIDVLERRSGYLVSTMMMMMMRRGCCSQGITVKHEKTPQFFFFFFF